MDELNILYFSFGENENFHKDICFVYLTFDKYRLYSDVGRTQHLL